MDSSHPTIGDCSHWACSAIGDVQFRSLAAGKWDEVLPSGPRSLGKVPSPNSCPPHFHASVRGRHHRAPWHSQNGALSKPAPLAVESSCFLCLLSPKSWPWKDIWRVWIGKEEDVDHILLCLHYSFFSCKTSVYTFYIEKIYPGPGRLRVLPSNWIRATTTTEPVL